jgi:uncharacterized protein (TIGR03435 family)
MRYQWNAIAGAALCLLAALDAGAQDGTARAEFEVASIKPATGCDAPGRGGRGTAATPGRLNLECTTLEDLILGAYVIFKNPAKPLMKRFQITGGPAWISKDRYTLAAKSADGNASMGQMFGPMLRALLQERFALKLHEETRDGAVFRLTVAKGGLKAKATPEGGCVQLNMNGPPQGVPPKGEGRTATCGEQRTQSSRGAARLSFTGTGMTMADFAGFLSTHVGRDVIDETRLAGMFDLHMEYSPQDPAAGPAAGGDAGALPGAASPNGWVSIFTALEEQVGLKLVAGKGPVAFLVIDRVEKPAEN